MSAQFPRHPFLLPVDDVVATLNTDTEKGLSSAQVAELSQKYPKNELDIGGGVVWYTIFIRQLCNAMVLVLFFALGLSYGVGDYVEGSVLAAVIVLNVSIGFFQEYGAEKKMDALRALSSPSANVIRDGNTAVIPNPEVVPGDIVILNMGDTVPADLRLFEAMNLTCDEQSLTGEAQPVEKSIENDIHVPGTEKLAQEEGEVGIGDRVNMCFAASAVSKGRGRGIVVATGMETEVGKIAKSAAGKVRKPGRSMSYKKYGRLQPVKGTARRAYDFLGSFLGLTEGTPLQIKLAKLAYLLFFSALLLSVVVFGVNEFRVTHEVVIYAISTGIAIIPESLVAVLTVTMVVATTVMRKANIIVRDLSALEALGGVTNICSDKTGTLTQGAMILKKVWLPDTSIYTVRGCKNIMDPTDGHVTYADAQSEAEEQEEEREYDRERTAQTVKFDVPDERRNAPTEEKDDEPKAEVTPGLKMFLLSAALCNLATVRYDKEWQTTGEPTEIALQVFAHRFNFGRKSLKETGWKEVAEFSFDSSIKIMTTIYDSPSKSAGYALAAENSHVFTKGAVERIIELCSHIGVGDAREEVTDKVKEHVLAQMTRLASQGQRVLAVAYREWDGLFTGHEGPNAVDSNHDALRLSVERNLTLLGLAGIYDPPRRETAAAIRECSSAGIKVHMLTGDHPETARAIAKEVGILPRDLSTLPASVAESCVQKATNFDKLTDAEMDAMEELPLVIARCAPETKTRMIEALRRRNAFMAMTGDGVNDAPSLSRADVGIAMGSGSDVAKGAAKIVLTDDKFDSIVAGIREGRRMFENVQKFVLHLLSSNIGEVLLLIAGLGFRDESGFSVFPISPLEILWINLLTSSFPAFGLGREPASGDVMRRSPHDKKRGVFTKQILWDMQVYGIMMGTTTLMTFVLVIYAANGGDLGHDCNRSWSEACRPVFRARASVFVLLTWEILISAWEFKSLRRSMFRLRPDSASRFPFFRNMWENKFLFWAVVIGWASTFPAVHIPGLNTNVFKHVGITWEWGLVFGMTVVYVLGVELWKHTKRTLHILDDHEVVQSRGWSQGSEEGGRTFTPSLSVGSVKSWKIWAKGRANTGAGADGQG